MRPNKLNLGTGRDIRDGYCNVDVIDGPGIDVVHDLNQFPYPFDDDQFNEIVAFHILEHLNADVYVEESKTVVGDAFRRAMDELHRILQTDGTLVVETPHFTSFHNTGQYQHRRGFHHESFRAFSAAADEPYTDRLWTVDEVQVLPQWIFSRPLRPVVNANGLTRNLFTATPLRGLLPQANIRYWLTLDEVIQCGE